MIAILKTICLITGIMVWVLVMLFIFYIIVVFIRETIRIWRKKRIVKKAKKKYPQYDKPMLFFKKRKQVADEYEKWLTAHNVKDTGESFVTFLSIKGWLDTEQVLKDLGRNQL